jgi:hypothetical protein
MMFTFIVSNGIEDPAIKNAVSPPTVMLHNRQQLQMLGFKNGWLGEGIFGHNAVSNRPHFYLKVIGNNSVGIAYGLREFRPWPVNRRKLTTKFFLHSRLSFTQ